MQHTLTIPNAEPITWDTDDHASVVVAETAFNQAKGRGLLAYDVAVASGSGVQGTVIQDFNPMTDIRMQTQHAGG